MQIHDDVSVDYEIVCVLTMMCVYVCVCVCVCVCDNLHAMVVSCKYEQNN